MRPLPSPLVLLAAPFSVTHSSLLSLLSPEYDLAVVSVFHVCCPHRHRKVAGLLPSHTSTKADDLHPAL